MSWVKYLRYLRDEKCWHLARALHLQRKKSKLCDCGMYDYVHVHRESWEEEE